MSDLENRYYEVDGSNTQATTSKRWFQAGVAFTVAFTIGYAATSISRTAEPINLLGQSASPQLHADLDDGTLGKLGLLGTNSRMTHRAPLGMPSKSTPPMFSAMAGDQCARRAVTAAAGLQNPGCSVFAKSAGFGIQSSLVRPAAVPSREVRAAASAERTYVMVKPDGVQRGLVGEIISRFERKGFTIKGLKLFQCPEELAKEHYGELSSKPFFKDLVEYILSGPVVCMVWEGKGVVASARKLIGATNPLESEPGTIRGDYAVEVGRNVIHGSDSIENGEREVGLWFSSGEGMAEWTPTMEPWLREIPCK